MSEEARRRRLARLLRLGVAPHEAEIARIVAGGDIAIVVFEPDDLLTAGPLAALGYSDSTGPVFAMEPAVRRRLARRADPRSRAWFSRRRGPARVYAFARAGALLLTQREGGAFAVEPG